MKGVNAHEQDARQRGYRRRLMDLAGSAVAAIVDDMSLSGEELDRLRAVESELATDLATTAAAFLRERFRGDRSIH